MWDLLRGKLAHSLEPLPRPHTTAEGSGEGGGEEGDEKGEEAPQVYTGLLLSQSRGALIGITYDHNIIFYDPITFEKRKQVCTCTCTCLSGLGALHCSTYLALARLRKHKLPIYTQYSASSLIHYIYILAI